MCNLNFNQCNGGSYYPPLLDTCRAQLRSLLNANTTTVINPTVEAAFAYANSIEPQIVAAGNVVIVRRQAGSGQSITDNNDGSFNLGAGNYSVEFSANGIVPAGGLSLGLVVDGGLNASSVASSMATGQAVDVFGRAIFSVGASGAMLSINNVTNNNLTINRANLIINRIN